MEFDRIKVHKGAVELDYTETVNGAKREIKEKDKEPTLTLQAALQAFSGYVLWVISGPESWAEDIEIMSVSIFQPEDEPRGIVVTALKKCSRARNNVMTINTPYLAEKAGETTATPVNGFLPATVPALIDDLENEATFYHNGQRGPGQETLHLDDSGNAKQVNERMAAAEGATTRKARGKKKDAVLGVGTVHNPDKTEVLDDNGVRQLLGSVDRDVPVDAIAAFMSSEREQAIAWALARQRELVGSLKEDELMPAEPPCILRSATLPLSAEAWSAPQRVVAEGE